MRRMIKVVIHGDPVLLTVPVAVIAPRVPTADTGAGNHRANTGNPAFCGLHTGRRVFAVFDTGNFS
jgi:hypothetical protein